MAAPDGSTTIEQGIGGLPLVGRAGLNTNQATNFSGTTVDTAGNITLAAGATTAFPASVSGPTGSFANAVIRNTITGPTGSFASVNIQGAGIQGSTGSAALLGTAGASGGGPAAAQMQGWTVVYVAGVKSFVPYWQ